MPKPAPELVDRVMVDTVEELETTLQWLRLRQWTAPGAYRVSDALRQFACDVVAAGCTLSKQLTDIAESEPRHGQDDS